MHDKATIFARFTNTQKVPKSEVVSLKPLCRKWMSRGDGIEIDSVISSTALSLHYLHSCKIWRYFIQINYHSGSAREAISASSLVRYLHRRHHLRLFQQFRPKITSTRTLINFLWYIRPCMSLSPPQFNHIYYFLTTISSSLSKSASFRWPNCDT